MSDADTEVREHALRQARKRGIVALAVTAVLVIVVLALFRASIDSPPGLVACTTSSDCEGVIGVECLHAPTQTYCTHTCRQDDDCEKGLHCDSPPWEKEATRLLCLRSAPPAK